MKEREMLNTLEEARLYSASIGDTVWAFSNGEHVVFTTGEFSRNYLSTHGYWIAAIFENGHRVEA